MWPNHLYAEARRELVFDRGSGRFVFERLDLGCARADGKTIDVISGLQPLAERAPEMADTLEELEREEVAPPLLPSSIERARLVFTRRVVLVLDAKELVDESWVICSNRWDRRVCRPEHLAGVELAEVSGDTREVPAVDPTSLPILFTGGSAALVFHELAGHGSAAGSEWPDELVVQDRPVGLSGEPRKIDDGGGVTRIRNLLEGEELSLRRGSFRDVPIPRMFRMWIEGGRSVETSSGRRVKISRIGEGRYDGESGIGVWLVATSSLISEDGKETLLAPWKLTLSLQDLRRRLVSIGGPVEEHPPMLCSDGGQRIPVSHFSAEMFLGGR